MIFGIENHGNPSCNDLHMKSSHLRNVYFSLDISIIHLLSSFSFLFERAAAYHAAARIFGLQAKKNTRFRVVTYKISKK